MDIDIDISINIEEDDTEDFEQIDLALIIDENNDHHLRPVLPRNHQTCASHTLNLVANKDTEDALKTVQYKKVLRSTFGKCQTVWNKQNQSTLVAEQIKSECGMYFITPVVTRWNSMYMSLKRFSNIFTHHSKDNLMSLFDKIGLRHLTPTEIKFINEYVLVTRPLAKALDFLQGM